MKTMSKFLSTADQKEALMNSMTEAFNEGKMSILQYAQIEMAYKKGLDINVFADYSKYSYKQMEQLSLTMEAGVSTKELENPDLTPTEMKEKREELEAKKEDRNEKIKRFFDEVERGY